LRIQLSWDKANDIDLHLLAPPLPGTEASVSSFGEKIYYGNPSAAWGNLDSDSGADDFGYGPEKITVNHWPIAGKYLVRAETYADYGFAPVNGALTFLSSTGKTLHRQEFQLTSNRPFFEGSGITVAPNGNVTIDGIGNVNLPLGAIVGNASQTLPLPITQQAAYSINDGEMSVDAIATNATGSLGRGTLRVSIDLERIFGRRYSSDYNVFILALVPGRQLGSEYPSWFSQRATDGWGVLFYPVAPARKNVYSEGDPPKQFVDILSNADFTRLVGTEIYLGLGSNVDEMLANRRYRGIYKVVVQ
jgi:hypothetical protein